MSQRGNTNGNKIFNYSSQRAHRSRQYERGSSAERRYKRSHRRSPTSKKHRHHHDKTTVSRKKHRSYSTDQVSISFILNILEQQKFGAVREYFEYYFFIYWFSHCCQVKVYRLFFMLFLCNLGGDQKNVTTSFCVSYNNEIEFLTLILLSSRCVFQSKYNLEEERIHNQINSFFFPNFYGPTQTVNRISKNNVSFRFKLD